MGKPLTALPEGYNLILTKQTPARARNTVLIYLWGLAVFGVFTALSAVFSMEFGVALLDSVPGVMEFIIQVSLALFMAAAVIATHEFMRGWITSILVKTKIKIGFSLGMMYCVCPAAVYTKRQYIGYSLGAQLFITAVLVPLALLTGFSIMPHSWFLVMYFGLAAQFAVSVRELATLFRILRLPRGCLIKDNGKCIEIYGAAA